MTQEEKDLLLKDLCARLPYGVKAEILNEEDERKQVVVSYGNICYIPELGNWRWKECKPYLFPLSSMTEEQEEEYLAMYEENRYSWRENIIDWFHKNHFDWRDLIPMGLANDATGLSIY